MSLPKTLSPFLSYYDSLDIEDHELSDALARPDLATSGNLNIACRLLLFRRVASNLLEPIFQALGSKNILTSNEGNDARSTLLYDVLARDGYDVPAHKKAMREHAISPEDRMKIHEFIPEPHLVSEFRDRLCDRLNHYSVRHSAALYLIGSDNYESHVDDLLTKILDDESEYPLLRGVAERSLHTEEGESNFQSIILGHHDVMAAINPKNSLNDRLKALENVGYVTPNMPMLHALLGVVQNEDEELEIREACWSFLGELEVTLPEKEILYDESFGKVLH